MTTTSPQNLVSITGFWPSGVGILYNGYLVGLITPRPPHSFQSKFPMSHLIKDWIEECENCHQNDLQLAPRYKHPIEIVLVDVRDQKLVRASSSWRFLTISYVWREAVLETTTTTNREARGRSGALSEIKLPQLICDAMMFVSQMGEDISGSTAYA
jgi:hypothetical protein